MQSIIQILKLNEVRKGVSSKTGRPYEMQDAECLLLNDDGTPASVGVLQIPRELMGKAATGTFLGTFGLRPNLSTRRIEAVLTGLNDYVPAPVAPVRTPAPTAVVAKA
ncbi:MAG: hypothetical protein EOO80_01010 [Oxalobacteraceae bacterium]|nr:MAG: hypothetical protein EOO80_01010 [Oxalobacteraceae bacterium]